MVDLVQISQLIHASFESLLMRSRVFSTSESDWRFMAIQYENRRLTCDSLRIFQRHPYEYVRHMCDNARAHFELLSRYFQANTATYCKQFTFHLHLQFSDLLIFVTTAISSCRYTFIMQQNKYNILCLGNATIYKNTGENISKSHNIVQEIRESIAIYRTSSYCIV